MAKPNYSFAKRQRELAKKKKKEEKRQRKAAEAEADLGGEVADEPDATPSSEEAAEDTSQPES